MGEDFTEFFRGCFEHKLDTKGRISLPSAFRETLRRQGSENEFVIIPRKSGRACLTALSREAHNRLVRSLRDREYSSPKQREAARNFYITRALLISMEDTGRFVLTQTLRDQIGLPKGGEVVFAADGSAFEIWAKADYDTLMADIEEPDFDLALGEL